LAFGDKDIEAGDIDDKVISNNGDSEKVLATVVATVYAFIDKYPNVQGLLLCWYSLPVRPNRHPN
jgi:hypothetical protein